jgi:hypothetical protein
MLSASLEDIFHMVIEKQAPEDQSQLIRIPFSRAE